MSEQFVQQLMKKYGYQASAKGYENNNIILFWKKGNIEFSWKRKDNGKFRVKQTDGSGIHTLRRWDELQNAEGFLEGLHGAEG